MIRDDQLELATAAMALHGWDRYAVHGLSAGHYASERARLLHQTCEVSQEQHGKSSPSAVAVTARRAGTLAALGGSEGLQAAYEVAHTGDPAGLRRLVALRAAYTAAKSAERATLAGDLPKAVEALSGYVPDLCETRVKTASDVVGSALQRLTTGQQRTVHPGCDIMRDAIGDFVAGSMVLLGAGSNVGKSSLAIELLMAQAARNVTCGYISLEDPEDLVGARLLSAYSGVPAGNLLFGLRPGDADVLPGAVAKVREMSDRLLFADLLGGDDVDVMAAMTQMAARGARTVVVDYLGCIESSSTQQDRRNDSRWIAARLKACAARLGVVLVLVTQLTIKDGDENKRPSKQSIRESRDVMHAAETVILLWRDSEVDNVPVHAWVAKNKSGGIGRQWDLERNGSRLLAVRGSESW